MAQKTCDAKPCLTARTPLGMTQREDGGLELKSCHDPSTTRPDAPESGAEEKVGPLRSG
jgi:hypothetical protein